MIGCHFTIQQSLLGTTYWSLICENEVIGAHANTLRGSCLNMIYINTGHDSSLDSIDYMGATLSGCVILLIQLVLIVGFN